MKRVVKLTFDDEVGFCSFLEMLRVMPCLDQSEETTESEYRAQAVAALSRQYLDSLRAPQNPPVALAAPRDQAVGS